jgi:O-antigen ligase
LSWWKKLVGYGPETLGILMLQKTANNPYGEVFDSAHNEYIHLLTTVGLGGLLSYLSFILGIVVRGIRLHINRPCVVAVIFGIICYSAQAFVNLNLPIVTPVFWILLGIASANSLEFDNS